VLVKLQEDSIYRNTIEYQVNIPELQTTPNLRGDSLGLDS